MTPKLQILRTADGYGLSLPMYDSKDHMGLALMAAIPDVIKLESGDVVSLPVGFAIGIPKGMCGFIHSVHDLVREKGLIVVASPMVLNPADRGPLFILIKNDSPRPQFINRGEVIAQLIISSVYQVCWNEVESKEEGEATSLSDLWVSKQEATEAPVEEDNKKEPNRRPVQTVRMRSK